MYRISLVVQSAQARPPDYCNWNNVNRRSCHWGDKSVWGKILERLIDRPYFEWRMIDASHIKVHQHTNGAVSGNQNMGRTKRANSKIHLDMDAHGMSVRISVTSGIVADCTQATWLIDGRDRAEYLLADRDTTAMK